MVSGVDGRLGQIAQQLAVLVTNKEAGTAIHLLPLSMDPIVLETTILI